MSEPSTYDANVTDDDLAHRLAQEAGDMLYAFRAAYGETDTDTNGGSRGLRDDGDKRAHDFLVGRLEKSRPHDAVLSEEGVDDPARLSASRLWIVDPLDGTWEFGQGRDDWAVHVALWETGRLVAGAVALPCSRVTYSTSASLSSATAVQAELPTSRPIRIVVSRTRPPRSINDIAAAITRETSVPVELVRMGSAGAKAAEVLAGRVDAYLHDSGLSEWDAAAPVVVAVASRCAAWRFDGSELRFNQSPPLIDGLVIATPTLEPYLRNLLA